MKKLLLTVIIAAVLLCTLAFAVSAEETSVHNGKVDVNATVTLNDGTVCNLFDSEGNALIWYIDTKNELQSIRADDSRVKFKATYAFNVGNKATVGVVTAYEVSDMWIQLENVKVEKTKIVVLNLMDDDVLINEASNNAYLGHPVNCVKTIQWANKNLEYAYLRLDTVAIQQSAFNGCTKLKYVNVEELTELRQIGGGSPFANSPELFKGQVLDLTRTKLYAITGNAAFNYMSIVGLKLPDTLVEIGDYNIQGTAITSIAFPVGVAYISSSQFNDCKSLTEIYINSTTTKIGDRAFNNTALEKIFYVGTLEQLEALLYNTGENNNAPFWAVVGENRENIISYEDYLKLEDKSGKYVVYNYSKCEAYNDGAHTFSGSVEMDFKGFFETIMFMDTCVNDGCGVKAADESKTIAPIFTWKGYSAATYGQTRSITQGFGIDHAAINAYKTYNPDFDFGIFATVNKTGAAYSPDVNSEDVILINFDNAANNFIDVKVTGIPLDKSDSLIVFCAYVTDGEGIYYLDGGITAETVIGISYNEIVKQ